MKEQLKKIRKDLRMTQADFGEATGKNRDIISNYELGRVVPDDTFVQLVALKYGYNEDWIRTGAGEPKRPEPLADGVIREATAAVRLDPEQILKRIQHIIDTKPPETIVLMWRVWKNLQNQIPPDEKAADSAEG